MIKTFYFNPYRECTYVIYKDRASACIIIDCGAYDERERQRLAMFIRDNELTPVAHLVTHTHPDHVCGLEWLEETYGIRSTIYPAEGALSISANSKDVTSDSESTSLKDELFGISVLRTPGHKEDSVCYLFSVHDLVHDASATQGREESEGACIFTGDTLFQESIGRTDLPGGNMSELMTSLKRLSQLPPETTVYPGHGYPTTIEHELQYNPYL